MQYRMYSTVLRDQELCDEKKRNGQRAGAWLAAQDAGISQVLSFDQPVYRQLALKLVKAMGGTAAMIHALPEKDTGKELAAYILTYSLQHPGSLLLVGPPSVLPATSDGKEDALWSLKIGSKGQNKASCKVQSYLPVQKLPKKFPYPFPNGMERRKRPAYYYQQSSVIPFQRQGQDIRVLVIGSSKKKHQVVPKGIHEPGLSAQDSAAKESLEEAGVKGPVLPQVLGSYVYKKWGAACTVQVYAQEVSSLVPEEQWQERHRGRQWLTPKEAASCVREARLGPLILKLQTLCHEGSI